MIFFAANVAINFSRDVCMDDICNEIICCTFIDYSRVIIKIAEAIDVWVKQANLIAI